MRLDEDNNPIVVEEVKTTKASKFVKAMEEDGVNVYPDDVPPPEILIPEIKQEDD